MERQHTGSFSKLSWLWAGLFFTAMAVVMTWPLALRMTDEIAGQIGDNIYFIWMIGWFRKALFELHVNPLDVWFLNYPEGWSMAYTEIAPAMVLIGVFFSFIKGITFGYNATMLFSFAASGLTMFIWVRHLTRNTGAALIAGMLYGFLPYHVAHFLIGHLNLVGTQWFPLFFMGLWELLSSKDAKPARGWYWLTGISLGLISWTSTYYIFMTGFVSAIMTAYYLLIVEKGAWRSATKWRRLALAGVVALPMLLVASQPYISLLGQGGLPDRDISITRRYSASPTDFILPSTDHFLWGRWVGETFNRDIWVEGTLYIGLVTLFLVVWLLIKRRGTQWQKLIHWSLFTVILGVILAMGTDLHWLSEPVEIATPAFLKTFIQRETVPLVLPGYFLFKYFPFYAKLRSLMRFAIFALLFLTVLAGLGAARLLQNRSHRSQTILTIVLLALIFLDFYPGAYQQFARIESRPVDAYLATQPDDGALVQMPFIQAEDQEHTYYTLFHHKPYIGGFFNAFPPPQYRKISPVLERFPDDESIVLLRQMGVKYVIVDSNAYPDIGLVTQTLEVAGMQFVNDFDGQLLFVMEK